MTRLGVASYDTSSTAAHSRILEGVDFPHPCCPLPPWWITASRTTSGGACRGCGLAGWSLPALSPRNCPYHRVPACERRLAPVSPPRPRDVRREGPARAPLEPQEARSGGQGRGRAAATPTRSGALLAARTGHPEALAAPGRKAGRIRG